MTIPLLYFFIPKNICMYMWRLIMSRGCKANYSITWLWWRRHTPCCVVEPQRLHKHLLRGPAPCLMKHHRGPENSLREARTIWRTMSPGPCQLCFQQKPTDPSLPPSSVRCIPNLLLPAQTYNNRTEIWLLICPPPPESQTLKKLGFVCSVIKKCFKLKCGSGGVMV